MESTKVIPGTSNPPGRAGSIVRFCSLSFAAALFGINCAHAIVSDRHLQGVRAIECELESSRSEFRMLVNAKKHTLQLEDDPDKIAYEEVSEDTLRFVLTLPEAPQRICELQFPAGALVCTSNVGKADLGFCLTVQ